MKPEPFYTLRNAFGEFFYNTKAKTSRDLGTYFNNRKCIENFLGMETHKQLWEHRLVRYYLKTYENPKEFMGACDFDTEKELRLN